MLLLLLFVIAVVVVYFVIAVVVYIWMYFYSRCIFIQVLNELLIDRGSAQSLSNLDVYCNDRLITSVQGDGKLRGFWIFLSAHKIIAPFYATNTWCILVAECCWFSTQCMHALYFFGSSSLMWAGINPFLHQTPKVFFG